jgi:O-antigen ligase
VKSLLSNPTKPTECPLLLAMALAVIVAGVGIPWFFVAFGDSTASVIAVPMVLLLAVLFIVNRTWLLCLVLLGRASADIFLEMTRSSGIGAGAVINASVILLAIVAVLEKPKAVPLRMVFAWAAFFVTALYGLLLAPYFDAAARFYLTWLSNFAMFVLAFHVIDSNTDFRFFAKLVLLSSVLPAAYSVWDTYAAWSAGLHLGGSGFRLRSTFTHANIFAFYLTLMVILGFYLIKSRPEQSAQSGQATPVMQKIGRAVLILYLLFLVGLLGLTQTRSAWLACIIVFLAYGLLFEWRYLLLIVLFLAAALLLPVVQERVLDLLSGNGGASHVKLNSFAWRVLLWKSALHWMQPTRYLFGYGIGGFEEYAPVFFSEAEGFHWDAHNVYIQWFFDVGLIGLAAYVWIYARLLYLLRALFRIERLLGFAIVSLIVAYLFVSLSDNMMFYLAFNWYFWFIVGAACALVRGRQSAKEPRTVRAWPRQAKRGPA